MLPFVPKCKKKKSVGTVPIYICSPWKAHKAQALSAGTGL